MQMIKVRGCMLRIIRVKVPGMSVTVYLPPYLVGLKMSDWTLAKAGIKVLATYNS